MDTLTGTNPADQGETFALCGADQIRKYLTNPETTQGVKLHQLHEEFGQIAKYHNWIFDRIQEVKGGHHGPKRDAGSPPSEHREVAG